MSRLPWLVGPVYDLTYFIGAGLPLCLLLLLNRAPAAVALPFYVLGLGIVGGSHFFGTWTITHLDPAMRQRDPWRYGWVAVLVLVGAFSAAAVHLPLLINLSIYWGIYHQTKQHFGFIQLYKAKARDFNRFDYHIGKWLLFSGHLVAVLYAASRRPQEVAGFGGVPLYWLPLPTWLLGALAAVFAGLLGVWLVRLTRKEHFAWPPVLMMASALAQYFIAFLLARDFLLAYLITNVAHSVQYQALVWFYNRTKYAKAPEAKPGVAALFRGRNGLLYLGAAGLYAALVGALEKSGDFARMTVTYGFMGLIIYHYIVDAWIWRKQHNPDLIENLRLNEGGRSS
ncbi:MAG TPA: hypothetical protein VK464_25865 [Symbiobacteriaceae bacterium]|jgi:hypothetical protein|nr:hypothetical protein [Symbiobacteriaceae bacterium]